MSNDVKVSGFIVLFVGVALLFFTFISAYLFLIGVLSIPSTQGIVELFGVALAPLIEGAIRVLYLGVMGWIGSILTRRGIQIITIEHEAAKATTIPRPIEPTEPNKGFVENKEIEEIKDSPKGRTRNQS